MYSLAIMAALLSKQYNITITSDGVGAYSAPSQDGGYVINIPACVDETDKDELALVNAFIDHEAAHVRFTDFHLSEDKSKLFRTLHNIFEDTLVERRMADIFVGCRRNFAKACKIIFDKRYEEPETGIPSILTYCLYYTRSKDHECMRQYLPAIRQVLPNTLDTDALDSVLDRIDRCKTTQDTFALTQDVMDFLAFSALPMTEPDSVDVRRVLIGERMGNIITNAQQTNPSAQQGHSIECRDTRDNPTGFGSPSPVDLPKRSYAKPALSITSHLDAQLQALMQHRQLSYCASRRRGKIDLHNIARLTVSDPRIFCSRVEKEKVNTDVIIIADASGSMDGMPIAEESKAVYALCHSLARIHGVHTQAYAFYGDLLYTLLKRDEPVHKGKFLINNPQGLTPGGSILQRALQFFDYTQRTKKIIIFMTDGKIDDPRMFFTAYYAGKRQGVDVLGIMIGDKGALPSCLPARDKCQVDSAADLPSALFKIMRDRLLT